MEPANLDSWAREMAPVVLAITVLLVYIIAIAMLLVSPYQLEHLYAR